MPVVVLGVVCLALIALLAVRERAHDAALAARAAPVPVPAPDRAAPAAPPPVGRADPTDRADGDGWDPPPMDPDLALLDREL